MDYSTEARKDNIVNIKWTLASSPDGFVDGSLKFPECVFLVDMDGKVISAVASEESALILTLFLKPEVTIIGENRTEIASCQLGWEKSLFLTVDL